MVRREFILKLIHGILQKESINDFHLGEPIRECWQANHMPTGRRKNTEDDKFSNTPLFEFIPVVFFFNYLRKFLIKLSNQVFYK